MNDYKKVQFTFLKCLCQHNTFYLFFYNCRCNIEVKYTNTVIIYFHVCSRRYIFRKVIFVKSFLLSKLLMRPVFVSINLFTHLAQCLLSSLLVLTLTMRELRHWPPIAGMSPRGHCGDEGDGQIQIDRQIDIDLDRQIQVDRYRQIQIDRYRQI